MKLNVAIAQMDVVFGDPDANFSKLEDFVKQAAEQSADIVIFPEMWNTGYDLTHLTTIADEAGQRTKSRLAELAKQYQLTIHGGSVATNRAGKFYNTTYVFGPSGQLLADYDKVHLFGLMNEDAYLTPGDHGDQFEVAGVQAASVICYDVRFPEWLRTLSLHDSRLLIVPSEWPTPRLTQWHRLLAARAIENQSFVVGVNRVGTDPDNAFGGQSVVYNPLGDELIRLDDQEQLATVVIDIAETTAARGFMPVFSDRRPDLYE
ncbi:carbon-nitrogen family hydrolase [uncultured Secundilactobacillus sp.]|uniref:carbon-nitrogen family hydrolase n=1 Tax=uncultured Secundilactobacillus sp. TaxID=2813935 RepID=UPI00258B783C|nr:carbon-nitrogen family hydrolase [uncultured Secundilactobacillus sp.]